MDCEIFIQKIAEITENEADTISIDMSLGDINGWDSLGAITFLAMADAEFGVSIQASSLANARTVQDLYDLVCQDNEKDKD